MSKHTPGPWQLDISDSKDCRVINSHGSPVVDCCTEDSLLLAEEKGNARLIAAAPDLLRCLRDLERCVSGQPVNFHSNQYHERDVNICLANARDVIAKATND
jgi:hypothetical protein